MKPLPARAATGPWGPPTPFVPLASRPSNPYSSFFFNGAPAWGRPNSSRAGPGKPVMASPEGRPPRFILSGGGCDRCGSSSGRAASPTRSGGDPSTREDAGEEMLRFYAERLRRSRSTTPSTACRPRDAAALGRAGAGRLHLRAQGLAAITHRQRCRPSRRRRSRYLFDDGAALGDRLGRCFPDAALPEEGRWRGCVRSWPRCRPRARSPSSSGTRPGSTTSLRRAARAQRRARLGGQRRRGRRRHAVVATADWGYLRLRRRDYDDAALASWAERIRAQPWREAYVFFKHEEGRPLSWPLVSRFAEGLVA